jgi:hypothetical protein
MSNRTSNLPSSHGGQVPLASGTSRKSRIEFLVEFGIATDIEDHHHESDSGSDTELKTLHARSVFIGTRSHGSLATLAHKRALRRPNGTMLKDAREEEGWSAYFNMSETFLRDHHAKLSPVRRQTSPSRNIHTWDHLSLTNALTRILGCKLGRRYRHTKISHGLRMMLNNGAIAWKRGRRQPSTVALSTMESEYMALTEATKELK